MEARTAGRTFFLMMVVAVMMLAALPAGPAGAVERIDELADELLREKCSLCHGGDRIRHMNPGEAKRVVERMQKMNPDWITEVDKQHILEVLSGLLNDSTIIAERRAWEEAVERGRALFKDASLGTTGQACADCHSEDSLRKTADEFPRYEPERRALVSFPEKINMMVTGPMKGEAIKPLSQKMIDLEAYLKSLR